jgi:Fe-S oxidoreductase
MERHGRWSYCCGDGIGTTSNYDFEYAKSLGVDRLNEAKKFADIVITSCPHCNSHMKKVSGEEKMTLELTDLPILVAEAMGLN